MNCDSVQFWLSTPNCSHSLSPQLAMLVPEMSMPSWKPPLATALAATTFSWSTSVSHGRSVWPFHWAFLAFSYSLSSFGR